MRAPRRYTRPSIHAPRDACISLARVQEMRAPLLLRASKTCARRSSCVRPKMAAPTGARAKDARATATRDAKMRVSEQLQKVRPSLVAPILSATFSPTIRRSVKGGSAIKELAPPSIQRPPAEFFLHRPKSIRSIFSLSTTPLSLEFSAIVEFSRDDRV